MSLKLRKLSIDPVQGALVNEHNALRDANVGTNIHACATAGSGPTGDPPTVTPLTTALGIPTDLPTSVALTNDLFRILNEHFPDTYAHKSAVSPALTVGAAPVATNLATGLVRANAIKAAYTTHLTAANVHFTNDAVNTIAAANGTDLATLITLLTELRTDVPAHIASALAGQHIELISA